MATGRVRETAREMDRIVLQEKWCLIVRSSARKRKTANICYNN